MGLIARYVNKFQPTALPELDLSPSINIEIIEYHPFFQISVFQGIFQVIRSAGYDEIPYKC